MDNLIWEKTSANFKDIKWFRGHILVSEELATSDTFKKALRSISEIFIEKIRVKKEAGILKIEGWSYLFEERKEGEDSPQYDAIFINENDGTLSFKEFIKIT